MTDSAKEKHFYATWPSQWSSLRIWMFRLSFPNWNPWNIFCIRMFGLQYVKFPSLRKRQTFYEYYGNNWECK